MIPRVSLYLKEPVVYPIKLFCFSCITTISVNNGEEFSQAHEDHDYKNGCVLCISSRYSSKEDLPFEEQSKLRVRSAGQLERDFHAQKPVSWFEYLKSKDKSKDKSEEAKKKNNNDRDITHTSCFDHT